MVFQACLAAVISANGPYFDPIPNLREPPLSRAFRTMQHASDCDRKIFRSLYLTAKRLRTATRRAVRPHKRGRWLTSLSCKKRAGRWFTKQAAGLLLQCSCVMPLCALTRASLAIAT